jgi:hypothetical protein
MRNSQKKSKGSPRLQKLLMKQKAEALEKAKKLSNKQTNKNTSLTPFGNIGRP